MELKTPVKVLVLENDPQVVEKIHQVLNKRPYKTTCFGSSHDALTAIKETRFSLFIAGHNAEQKDPVDVIKEVVMISPMTSIVLVTDLSDSDVHEKAEGYGILGNINRKVPPESLLSLLDTHEKIQKSLGQP